MKIKAFKRRKERNMQKYDSSDSKSEGSFEAGTYSREGE